MKRTAIVFKYKDDQPSERIEIRDGVLYRHVCELEYRPAWGIGILIELARKCSLIELIKYKEEDLSSISAYQIFPVGGNCVIEITSEWMSLFSLPDLKRIFSIKFRIDYNHTIDVEEEIKSIGERDNEK